MCLDFKKLNTVNALYIAHLYIAHSLDWTLFFCLVWSHRKAQRKTLNRLDFSVCTLHIFLAQSVKNKNFPLIFLVQF